MSIILTSTNKLIDLTNIDESLICIEDISHALSNICRFGGHCLKHYCVDLNTKVLTSKLDWVCAGDLKLYQSIYAIEEKSNLMKNFKRNRKKALQAWVTSNAVIKRPCYKIYLKNGDELTSSEEHPWLVAIKNSGNQKWIKTIDLFQDVEYQKCRFFLKYFDVWKKDDSWKAGWLSGMFDGEGSLSSNCAQIQISQNLGPTFERIKNVLKDYNNFKEWRCVARPKIAHIRLSGQWQDKFKFLGVVKPERLIDNLWNKVKEHPLCCNASEMVGIDKIEFIGTKEVAALETSEHTYFANGYAAHNSVAEHAVLVSRLTPKPFKMLGLHHDDAEFLYADLVTPLKALLPEYIKLEDAAIDKILHKLQIKQSLKAWREVKKADIFAFTIERSLLFNNQDNLNIPKCFNWKIGLSPKKAKQLFLEEHDKLSLIIR